MEELNIEFGDDVLRLPISLGVVELLSAGEACDAPKCDG